MVARPSGTAVVESGPSRFVPHGVMTTRLLQLWRACCGAIAFAAFGGLALLLGALVLPVDRRLSPEGADRRAQLAIHRSSRLFLALVQGLGVLRIQVDGGERLRRDGPRLIVANHPTLFDIVLLCALLPQMDCVVKASWTGNPFLRGLIRGANHVCGDSPRHVLRACIERLRRGRTLLVFPEGTRSPRGGLGPFHRGAAHIALACGVPIVPVVISCRPPILSKGQKWYDLASHPVRVAIRVRDEIHPDPSAASRQLGSELREFFAKELDLVDAGT